MFESINDAVQQQLETQGVPTPKSEATSTPAASAAPAVPPPEPTVQAAEQAELERLRFENAELKQRQLEAERDQRLKAAIASTHVQYNGPTAGEMSVRRQRAIAESKGLAFWNKYSVSDRVNILTDGGYIPVTDKELAKYFGPKSKPTEVTRLKASDQKRYQSYRCMAIELGWIG